MKKLILSIALVSLLFSCKKESNLKLNEPEIHKELHGIWVGNPDDYSINTKKINGIETLLDESGLSKVSISINRITKNEVLGKSVFRGNEKPISGVLINENNNIKFVLKDKNDDKNGGVYTLKIKNNTLSGNWSANSKTANVISMTIYSLKKQEFIYNSKLMLAPTFTEKDEMPNELYIDYITKDEKSEGTYREANENIITKINASTTKLLEKDIKNYKKIDLEILKNTIYARHGLIFKEEVTRQFFNQSKWYVPFEGNVDEKLTPLEKENIILLQKFEKYATDNYDSFGR